MSVCDGRVLHCWRNQPALVVLALISLATPAGPIEDAKANTSVSVQKVRLRDPHVAFCERREGGVRSRLLDKVLKLQIAFLLICWAIKSA